MFDMFDTIAEHRIERASLSSPCQGLGGCNPHRARAEQQEAIERSFPGRIAAVQNELNSFETGTQQKEFTLLEQKQNNLRKERAEIDAKIDQAKLLSDAWESNPKQQAGVEGLGWFGKRLWNKAFSCEHYEDRLNESIARTRPLENQLTALNTKLNERRAKLSPENLQAQRNAVAVLEKEVAQKRELLSSYEKRITDARTSYQANKDAEKLALEREAQEAVAKEQAKATAKEQSKQTQTIILVGAALVGGYLLFRRKSPTNVSA